MPPLLVPLLLLFPLLPLLVPVLLLPLLFVLSLEPCAPPRGPRSDCCSASLQAIANAPHNTQLNPFKYMQPSFIATNLWHQDLWT